VIPNRVLEIVDLTLLDPEGSARAIQILANDCTNDELDQLITFAGVLANAVTAAASQRKLQNILRPNIWIQ
jgi:hypothetical protein